MLIACAQCCTEYEVESVQFGAGPRMVQCSACGRRWTHSPVSFFSKQRATENGFDEANCVPSDSSSVIDQASVDCLVTEPVASSASVSTDFAFEELSLCQRPRAMPDVEASTMLIAYPAVTLPLEAPSPVVEEPPMPLAAPSGRLHATSWIMLSKHELVAVSAAAATVMGLLSLLVILRGSIIELLPESGHFYRMFGLHPDFNSTVEITSITGRRERRADGSVLIVSGEVANVVNRPTSLPPIRVTLFDAHDEVLQSVTLPNASELLAAGEEIGFEARLQDPGPAARRVRIDLPPTHP